MRNATSMASAYVPASRHEMPARRFATTVPIAISGITSAAWERNAGRGR
jgi:hypothetical protein